jgi:hypothetical protein
VLTLGAPPGSTTTINPVFMRVSGDFPPARAPPYAQGVEAFVDTPELASVCFRYLSRSGLLVSHASMGSVASTKSG